jgi:hypothetical protein
MEELPVEINCQIFKDLTDPRDITRLFSTNAYLANIARDCITRLAWNDDIATPVSYNFIKQFTNLREVDMPLIITRDELTSLIDSKMNKFNAIIDLGILNKFTGRAAAEEEINFLAQWYKRKSENTVSGDFTFSSLKKGKYIRLSQGSLDFNINYHIF